MHQKLMLEHKFYTLWFHEAVLIEVAFWEQRDSKGVHSKQVLII